MSIIIGLKGDRIPIRVSKFRRTLTIISVFPFPFHSLSLYLMFAMIKGDTDLSSLSGQPRTGVSHCLYEASIARASARPSTQDPKNLIRSRMIKLRKQAPRVSAKRQPKISISSSKAPSSPRRSSGTTPHEAMSDVLVFQNAPLQIPETRRKAQKGSCSCLLGLVRRLLLRFAIGSAT